MIPSEKSWQQTEKLFYGLMFNNTLSVFQLQYFLPINKIKASCRGPSHKSQFLKIIEMCDNLIFKNKIEANNVNGLDNSPILYRQ